MGRIIKEKNGIITNAALERIPFWSPDPEVLGHNGESFKIIQPVSWRKESRQPDKYLVSFASGEIAEAEFSELSYAYYNGIAEYNDLGEALLGQSKDIGPFTYPLYDEGDMTVSEHDDSSGNKCVTIQYNGIAIVSVEFPKGEDVYYVVSPLSAKTPAGISKNMFIAQEYEIKASQDMNTMAIAPHGWLPYIINDNDPPQREVALKFGLLCLSHCKGIIVYAENGISNGMHGEIQRAYELGLDIRYEEPMLNLSPFRSTGDWSASDNRGHSICVAVPSKGFTFLPDTTAAGAATIKFVFTASAHYHGVSADGVYTSPGGTGQIHIFPKNMELCHKAISDACYERFGITLAEKHRQLSNLRYPRDKAEAAALLLLEALVFEKASADRCWRPGGCIHNSNRDSYHRCGDTRSGICDCFKEERDGAVPGYKIMANAFKTEALCNFELMKTILNEKD